MKDTARSVITALQAGALVDDAAFDRLYPDHVRRLSPLHWTPVSVALRAAALLAPEPGVAVLDIGAGPGKLCCLGALAHGGMWHGVELNPSLVDAAATVAAHLEVAHHTRFVAGDMTQLDWDRFDSLYLFNPFESLLFGGPRDADRWATYAEQVARTEERLAALSSGTRVVTFHGFGGEMPSSFSLAFMEGIGDGELALWVKQPRTCRGRRTAGQAEALASDHSW